MREELPFKVELMASSAELGLSGGQHNSKTVSVQLAALLRSSAAASAILVLLNVERPGVYWQAGRPARLGGCPHFQPAGRV